MKVDEEKAGGRRRRPTANAHVLSDPNISLKIEQYFKTFDEVSVQALINSKTMQEFDQLSKRIESLKRQLGITD